MSPSLMNWLQVVAAAMTPIGELRLAIPLGLWGLAMPWYQVFLLSLVGNMIPVLILVPSLNWLSRLLQRRPNPAGSLFEWWTRRVQTKQAARFGKYGYLALVILVAIPLPFTGAWTGTLASWVFRVPVRTSILLIGIGVLIAGIVVTALTVVGLHISLFIKY